MGRTEKFPTRTWFINCCLAFLSGNKPVHLIEHSVNLRGDQQLQRKEESEWWRWEECCCHCFYKHLLLLWLQSSCWRWQSDTACPPPRPDRTQNNPIIDTSKKEWEFRMYYTMYRINVSQFAVDVLAEFHEHIYRILQGKVKVEEKWQKPLGESWIL